MIVFVSSLKSHLRIICEICLGSRDLHEFNDEWHMLLLAVKYIKFDIKLDVSDTYCLYQYWRGRSGSES